MIIRNKYNLTYWSNIFKETTWKKLFNQLKVYIIKIKTIKKRIGISLCLSNSLVKSIKKRETILEFDRWLNNEGIYISSINGFVYRDFHEKNIKEKIYYPDWSSERRVTYTLDLIKILNQLKGNVKTVSISTLPISYLYWVKNKHKYYLLYKYKKLAFC